MADLEKLNEFFATILQDYWTSCEIDPYPVNISIVQDMWEAYSRIRPDHAEKQPEAEQFVRSDNGVTVPPKDFDGTFTVLLHSDYVVDCINNNNAYWIGTLVHEAAHVNDFMQFARLVNASDYDTILNRAKYRMFHLWTEFNAKAKGYYFIRKYTFPDMHDQSQVEHILNTELPGQVKYLTQAYNSTNDADKQLYSVVHFMGRMYVWQMLFPSTFNQVLESQLFASNPWMGELYSFLKSHVELERANEDFDIMKSILSQNFTGLDEAGA